MVLAEDSARSSRFQQFKELQQLRAEAEAADAKDWKKSEHNWNIKWKEFNLNVRNQYRSDYDHVEIGVKLGEPFTLAVRASEKDGVREYRPKLTHNVFSWDGADEEGNVEPFSLGEFIVGKVKDIIA